MTKPITDEQDNCKEFELEALIILKELKYGDMILNMALMKILDLISQERNQAFKEVLELKLMEDEVKKEFPESNILSNAKNKLRQELRASIKELGENK